MIVGHEVFIYLVLSIHTSLPIPRKPQPSISSQISIGDISSQRASTRGRQQKVERSLKNDKS